jgi:predicted O-methyltransferase YrrM
MTSDKELWTSVDQYIGGLLVRPDVALDAALQDSTFAGLPSINVSPAHGKMLHLIARMISAKRILEIGTLGGYSAIWMARALPADGKLITLEINPKHAEVAQANIARAGVASLVEIQLGPALDSLPRLAADNQGPFDLIFIDADKPSNTDYFGWGLKLSRPGSVIIVDNVVRNGGVIDPSNTDANVQGVRRFNEVLATETRVSATEIQTVGVKGYDGFALAVVTG